MKLPPIDYFYCSPLKRWIMSCKPFKPYGLEVSRISIKSLEPSPLMRAYIQERDRMIQEFTIYMWNSLGIKKDEL